MTDKSRLPDFLVIGAAKAGTTTIYRALLQHPGIFMSPVKEPRYFALAGRQLDYRGPGDAWANRKAVTDLDAYRSLFREAHAGQVIGEASPIYLYSREAPVRIRATLPQVKLIAILRNPVDRAFSHYLHLRRDGRETVEDFRAACSLEAGRIADGWEWSWHYARIGLYHRQIARYLESFPEDRIRVYLFEDLKRDGAAVLKDLCEFVGADEKQLQPLHKAYNVSGIPRSKTLYRAWVGLESADHGLRGWLKAILGRRMRQVLSRNMHRVLLRRPEVEREHRRELVEVFREDVQSLQRLLNKDLSEWLRTE